MIFDGRVNQPNNANATANSSREMPATLTRVTDEIQQIRTQNTHSIGAGEQNLAGQGQANRHHVFLGTVMLCKFLQVFLLSIRLKLADHRIFIFFIYDSIYIIHIYLTFVNIARPVL